MFSLEGYGCVCHSERSEESLKPYFMQLVDVRGFQITSEGGWGKRGNFLVSRFSSQAGEGQWEKYEGFLDSFGMKIGKILDNFLNNNNYKIPHTPFIKGS